jgi:hypothetical protein
MILGAGVFLFGGLTKLGLDLTNQKTRRGAQSQSRRAVTPLVIEGMQMPPEDGWTYHPPPHR